MVVYLVIVPVVRSGVDAGAVEGGHQFVVVPDTHRAANDLSDAGHQHVHLRHVHWQSINQSTRSKATFYPNVTLNRI